MGRTWAALELAGGPFEEHARDERFELIQAALIDFGVAAIEEHARGPRIFFHSAAERDRAAAALSIEFPDFAFSFADVEDEDWAARSQASLTAVTVGRITVAPPWDPAASTSPAPGITIVIQPSTGFGTGHHATTRRCLEALQHLSVDGRRVIDVGTGSGVLAIAASLLGAREALGVDDDPDAVAAAAENLERNPSARVTLSTADIRNAALDPFDVVIANLTGGLLSSAAGLLQDLAIPGGHLVLSGLMAGEEDLVLSAFDRCTVLRRAQEDEWVCVTLLRSR